MYLVQHSCNVNNLKSAHGQGETTDHICDANQKLCAIGPGRTQTLALMTIRQHVARARQKNRP